MRSIEPSILLFLQIPQHELDGGDCYVSKLGDYFLRPKNLGLNMTYPNIMKLDRLSHSALALFF